VTWIEDYLQSFAKSGRKALIGYITAGYPSKAGFHALVGKLQRAGLDLLEIGVPFSDPVADGPTIQRSSQKALENGVTLDWILDSLSAMRTIRIPVLLMTYSNPVLAMGLDRFFKRARNSRIHGVIIPDLIPEEGAVFQAAAARENISLVYLATPTTTADRLKKIAHSTTGFLYAVGLTGITGARKTLPPQLSAFLSQLRKVTRKPIALGFGISSPEQVRSVRRNVDAIIVGSALIDRLDQSVKQAERFVSSLQKALNPQPKEPFHAS
jgi:tryptophan synthase alpha chain